MIIGLSGEKEEARAVGTGLGVIRSIAASVARGSCTGARGGRREAAKVEDGRVVAQHDLLRLPAPSRHVNCGAEVRECPTSHQMVQAVAFRSVARTARSADK